VKLKITGIIVALSLAIGLNLIAKPDLDMKLNQLSQTYQGILQTRQIYIDPAELLELMYNGTMSYQIFDVRDDSDFNLFHIIDAKKVTLDQLKDNRFIKTLPDRSVIVLVSNDETKAAQAWKILAIQGVSNIYILAGGINYWLALFDNPELNSNPDPKPKPEGDDRLRHSFQAALGQLHPAANPDYEQTTKRQWEKKIIPLGRTKSKSGGCG